LAVGAAVVVTGGLGGSLSVWLALAVEVTFLGFLAAGIAGRRRGDRVLGTVLTALAAPGLVGAVGLSAVLVDDPVTLVKTVFGATGVAMTGVAMLLGSRRSSRSLLKLGAGTLLCCVLAGGVLRSASQTTLLVGVAGTVLAYDLGENAVSLGDQLGRTAPTRTVEAVHALGSLAVAGIAVLAARTVDGVGTPGMSLTSLSLLLVAVVLLLAAVHD
jgi:hypothetical protein